MGILKLMDFLKKKVPRSIRSIQVSDMNGKTVAIDASNVIYQFLIQTQGTNQFIYLNMPTDMQGNKTGHLIGLMARVTMCQQNNIKAVWVFDGPPPVQKYKQLSRRSMLKKEATEKMEEAIIQGDLLEALKHQKRTMKITQIEKSYAIKMLNLMGLPTIQAPGESQAQCAYLSKIGLVDGVVTEDMDCLTLGSKFMYKTFNKKKPVSEVNLEVMLEDMKVTMDEFIDFCIMCGCDYTGRISNIGPIRAFDLIKKHRSLQRIVQHLQKTSSDRFRIQSQFDFEGARQLFKQPLVQQIREPFQWKRPEGDRLKQFLSNLDFNTIRIKNWLQRADRLSV